MTGTTYKPIKNLKIFKYIFKVPLGPRLDFITSWSPMAALMFIAKAWIFLSTYAFGFKYWTFDIFFLLFFFISLIIILQNYLALICNWVLLKKSRKFLISLLLKDKNRWIKKVKKIINSLSKVDKKWLWMNKIKNFILSALLNTKVNEWKDIGFYGGRGWRLSYMHLGQ